MVDDLQAVFEQRAKELSGQHIAKVRYFDIPDPDDTASWNVNTEPFDLLAFGLDLEMQTGRVFGFTWGSEFIQYGLSFHSHSLKDELLNASSLDVSNQSRWVSLLHQRIHQATIYWHTFVRDGVQKRFPQDLELIFESGAKVFICARIYQTTSDELFPFADEIAVIFNDQLAQQYHVGPYA
jgi:hypothetical protein